ncbi:hypothetical protein DMA11_09595 [Marinilabiliaceae bacterium JC017]|nr:hypothetical protein DMA11_09595 [Marinilabiliaceae bacterium JC017]
MNKLFFSTTLMVAILVLATSCSNNSNQTKSKTQTTQNQPTKVYKVSEVMTNGAQLIGQKVTLKGLVNHVCSHSGKRCIVSDEAGDVSIRVEAAGKIKGFNRELSGSSITVTGIVREKRLEEEFINQWEQKALKEKVALEKEEQACGAELANIEKMKSWMQKHNKSYYSVYFLEGIDYDEEL